jgi:flagellar motor component MotA
MNMKIFTSLLILFSAITVRGITQKTTFNRPAFYSAMAANDLDAVNTQLSIVKTASLNEKDAYEGALLMKKAGMVTKAKEKLSLFKAGRLKLEASIKKDKANAEFNFLRLIIQEHAPKIVDYRSDIENDISAIRSNYKTLAPAVQQAISDYSKRSKVLNQL